MKIALTGASGFFGSNFLKAAKAKKWEISILDRNKQSLFDFETLKEFASKKDAIIHLAAIQRSDDIAEMFRVNVIGTKILLDAVAKYSSSATFVFASSFHVYSPKSYFAFSKILAEEMIRSYRKGPFEFSNSIILRFTNIYGKGSKPFHNSVVATFVNQIENGVPIRIDGDGSQKRDYLHISDAISALIKAVKYDNNEVETIDICSGRQLTLNELLNIMKALNNKSIEVYYNRDVLIDNWEFKKNYQKAKEILGWEPKVTVEKGFEELFE